jgi:hypothetical protein
MPDMLKVADSPAESPKCVRIQNEQELEAPTQTWVNRIVWFGKPDSPVLSGPTTVRGVVGLRRGSLSSSQVMSGR